MVTVKTSRWFGSAFAQSSLTVSDEGVYLQDLGISGAFPKESMVPYNQIAAVHLRRGLFTCEITVESAGGGKAVLGALPPEEAEAAVNAIRKRIANKNGAAS